MNWHSVVRWGGRLVGLLSAIVGFALREPVGVAFFGAYLLFELWSIEWSMQRAEEEIKNVTGGIPAIIDKMQEKVAGALFYEYLPEASLIWEKARFLTEGVHAHDEVRSTASTPNDPAFEEAILNNVLHRRMIYKRLVCYADPGAEPQDQISLFPSPSKIAGGSSDQILKSYLEWYSEFYKSWEARLENGHGENLDNIGMKVWFGALVSLASRTNNRFEVRSHGATLPSDYFIVNPHREDSHWKAVVGFPRLRGEGMRSGFSTTHPLLAKDLGLNWGRLWDQAPKPD